MRIPPAKALLREIMGLPSILLWRQSPAEGEATVVTIREE
jgi:hypothetical protein